MGPDYFGGVCCKPGTHGIPFTNYLGPPPWGVFTDIACCPEGYNYTTTNPNFQGTCCKEPDKQCYVNCNETCIAEGKAPKDCCDIGVLYCGEFCEYPYP